MEKNKWIIANLKMYLNAEETYQYLMEMAECKKEHLVLCPTSIYIPYFLKQGFSVGIQNISSSLEGPYTGEVSAKQAKTLGISYAILGHSERNNDDSCINRKLKIATKEKLSVILCIGETFAQHKNGLTKPTLKNQIRFAFDGIQDFSSIFLAYEPIWAVGTGVNPEKNEIQDTIEWIKKIVKETYQVELPVLYGGSVHENNVQELNQISSLDGFLLGESSTQAKELKNIIEVVGCQ